jgi:NADH-quinone oxidoreductase subunit K
MLFLFLDVGLRLAFLGISGIIVNQRNFLISVIAIELMLYGLNLYLIGLAICLDDLIGALLALFILTLAAAESALALAILICYYSLFQDIRIQSVNY